MTSPGGQPKFARVWRGRTVKEKADAYERYLLQNGIAPLKPRARLACRCCAKTAKPKRSS